MSAPDYLENSLETAPKHMDKTIIAAGFQAGISGYPYTVCPYIEADNPEGYSAWHYGYSEAFDAWEGGN